MRSHTGDRPFQCDFDDCNKAFATGYGLKSHRRIHTGEKPYPCINEQCDKAFKTSGDLQKHMRTHTGEQSYDWKKRSSRLSNIVSFLFSLLGSFDKIQCWVIFVFSQFFYNFCFSLPVFDGIVPKY